MKRSRKCPRFFMRRLCDRPNLFIVDHFLTDSECAAMITMAEKQGLELGTFIPYGQNKSLVVNDKSRMTAFENGANRLIARVEARIEEITKFPISCGERMKIVCYGRGAYVTPHHDFTRNRNSIVRDRIAQVLIYLNDVEKGGETIFPNIGIKVVPKKGRALFWCNVLGLNFPDRMEIQPKIPSRLERDRYSLHGSEPVARGRKWIACKFLHPKPFNPKLLASKA